MDSNIDNFPVAFCVIKDEKIIDCNLACCFMFGGTKKEELIGLIPYNLSPTTQPDGKDSIIQGKMNFKKAMIEKNVNFKWLHKKLNNEVFLSYINLIYINDVFFTFITNIDEIQKLEDNAKEKDYMYKIIFEENKNVMLLTDPKTCQIINCNKAAVKFYGYSHEELTQKSIFDISQTDRVQHEEILKAILSETKNSYLTKHILKTHEIRDVEINSFPIQLDHQDLIFSIVNDVTDKFKQNLMFNNLFTSSPYAIAILDNEQKVININNRFTDLFDYHLEDVLGKNLNDLITSTDYRDEYSHSLDKVFSENVVKATTIRKRRDNSLINVEILAFPIIFNNNIIGAYVHYIDVTQNVQNNEQLKIFKKALENSNEGVIITDNFGSIEWVNPTFTKITGYSLDDIKGKNPRILQSSLHNKDFYKNMWGRIIKDGHWHGEIWNKNKLGEIYPEWLNLYSIKNNHHITHFVGMVRDLSEMKTINQKMRILSQKDALTGLYNRAYFTEKLNSIIKSTEKNGLTAILFIDLDHFKGINDSLGHHVGDEMLIEISKRMQTVLMDDHLIARYGGDEFVVLLQDYKNRNHITTIARKLFSIINKPHIFEGNYLHVSASIGITLYPKDGLTSEELIQNADIAMYEAKHNDDKKIMFYSTHMKKEIEERFKIANSLRTSLEQKEVNIIYQPIFDIHMGKIIGAEANLRYKSPLLKVTSPIKLIEVAESTNQSFHIFAVFFDQVCAQIFKSIGVPVSVNVTMKQLEHSSFLSLVKETMNEYNISPHLIEFEFKDTNAKHSSSKVTKTISELKKMGINVTLDDVNEQNSTFGQIKNYLLDSIKIDSSMIKNINDHLLNYEYLKSLCSIASKVNIKVIAKGISQEEYISTLKEMNIRYAQGTYFSKPLNLQQLKMLIKTQINPES